MQRVLSMRTRTHIVVLVVTALVASVVGSARCGGEHGRHGTCLLDRRSVRRRRTHRLTWNQGNTSTFSDGVSTTSNWLSRSDNSCRQSRVRSRSHLSCVTSLSRRRRTSTCTGEARTQPGSAPCRALTSKRRSWYRVPPRLAPLRSPSGRLRSWCLSANQPSLRIRARSRCSPTEPHTMSVSHGRVPANWHRMPITRRGSCPRAPSHASMLRTPSTSARRTSTDGTVLTPAVPSKRTPARHNLTWLSGVRRRNRVPRISSVGRLMGRRGCVVRIHVVTPKPALERHNLTWIWCPPPEPCPDPPAIDGGNHATDEVSLPWCGPGPCRLVGGDALVCSEVQPISIWNIGVIGRHRSRGRGGPGRGCSRTRITATGTSGWGASGLSRFHSDFGISRSC